MAQPTDLQTQVNAVQWTNGNRAITGALLLSLFTTIFGILSSMGTWVGGTFTPNPVAITNVANANYAIQPTDRIVFVNSLAASRVLTLPPASSYTSGVLVVRDVSGAITPTVTLSLAPNGSDTINGAPASVSFYPGQDLRLAPLANDTGWIAR